jgi:hypothetical protein
MFMKASQTIKEVSKTFYSVGIKRKGAYSLTTAQLFFSIAQLIYNRRNLNLLFNKDL